MVGFGSARAGGGGVLVGGVVVGRDDEVGAEPVEADLLALEGVARAAALRRVAVDSLEHNIFKKRLA